MEDGFACRKCGHTSGHRDAKRGYYCYKCHHVESPTAGTLFHRVRFGLRKAFHIVFEMANSSKGMSSIQVGLRYGVQQKTAWLFIHKVRKAMESRGGHPMVGVVRVDKFVVGGAEEGKRGGAYETDKTKAVVAAELSDGQKIERVYARPIGDYSHMSLKAIFECHIDPSAKVRTDGRKGYGPLKREYDIEQVPSGKGRNFKQLHVIVHQIKSWIRTVPTHAVKKYIKSYFDEFCFRINRSQAKQSIFHKTVERMVLAAPLTYAMLTQKPSG